MKYCTLSLQSLRRVFHEGFTAQDIAEPLLSRDGEADAESVRRFMEQRHLQVIGIRQDGEIAGFAERESLTNRNCSAALQPFQPDQLILGSTPLTDVVQGLRDHSSLFVQFMGKVGGIITRTDLQKPPMRMWLFGMVTLIEMRMTRLIKEHASVDWHTQITPERLLKAEELLRERQRIQQNLDLLDCLQFGDKCRIIARDLKLRERTRFSSKRQIDEAAKRLERLRNHLAHSQDIISGDWETVVELSEQLDRLIEERPERIPVDEASPDHRA